MDSSAQPGATANMASTSVTLVKGALSASARGRMAGRSTGGKCTVMTLPRATFSWRKKTPVAGTAALGLHVRDRPVGVAEAPVGLAHLRG
jgi:hypothetical protein